jgi:hypothetical protein
MNLKRGGESPKLGWESYNPKPILKMQELVGDRPVLVTRILQYQ